MQPIKVPSIIHWLPHAQVDVEGFEPGVFFGAKDLLLKVLCTAHIIVMSVCVCLPWAGVA